MYEYHWRLAMYLAAAAVTAGPAPTPATRQDGGTPTAPTGEVQPAPPTATLLYSARP